MTSGLSKLLIPRSLGLNLCLAIGFIGAATGFHLEWYTAVLILIAFFGARNAGHAFNQIVDRQFDAQNPRTVDRPLVTGEMSTRTAWIVVGASVAMVIVAAWLINLLVLILAPVALLLVMGYSYTKRFTSWTTVVLGLVQSILPVAIYLATKDELPLAGVVAGVAVMLFGTGFETVHSLGDIESDMRLGLHSIPVLFGRDRSIQFVGAVFTLSLISFGAFSFLAGLAPWFFLGFAAMAVALAWEFISLRAGKRGLGVIFAANFAFGIFFLVAVLLGLYLPGAHL